MQQLLCLISCNQKRATGRKPIKEGQKLVKQGIYFFIYLPAFLDTCLPRGNVHERDSGPMRGAIPIQSHNR